jgi:ribosomal protein S18 acetylase RimI-like enzyme
MIIRDYKVQDETGWVRCRAISFLDCSYFDDVKREKEVYENPSVCLVAEENATIIGFIDVEYEKSIGEVCYLKGDIGATIWNLGVLPEYRKEGVAWKLFEKAKERLLQQGIKRIEVWTQDDEESNNWYLKQGFIQKEAYLNAYMRGTKKEEYIQKIINLDNLGEIYGIRTFNFEAPVERKEELLPLCYRLHEVRVYEVIL